MRQAYRAKGPDHYLFAAAVCKALDIPMRVVLFPALLGSLRRRSAHRHRNRGRA